MCLLFGSSTVIPSEARFLLRLEHRSMASGHIFRVCLNILSYSLQQLRPHLQVLLCQKLWAPSRWSCKAYKLYGSAGLHCSCAYWVNWCSRGQKWSHLLGPKLFVLLLMVKMLLPMACQLAYSWLHCSKIDNIMELLLLLMLQHRQKAPVPCHMNYMCINYM